MNYPLISIKELVGSVLRRTGCKDTSLIPDLHEWIAEGMGLLETSITLEKCFATVPVKFHKAKKICGLREIWAIEYCGHRLYYNNGIRDPRAGWEPREIPGNVFDAVFVSTTTRENTPTGNFLYESEFKKVQNLTWHGTHWYKLDNLQVLTSFEEGEITIFYGKIPQDEQGFLLIPDEENYKQAMRYFLREALHVRGYSYGDLNELQLHEMFERYQARAISNITYPSPDQVQATTDVLIRLLPNLNHYEDLFTTIGPESYSSWT